MRRTTAVPRLVGSSTRRTGVSSPERTLRTLDDGAIQTVMDQQGSGRVVHRPDGTIVWEPLADSSSKVGGGPLGHAAGRKALAALETAGWAVLVVSGVVATSSAVQQVDQAHRRGVALTSSHLTTAVAHTVASTVAGMITGTVLGPVRAATTLATILARPAVCGFVVHRSVAWVQRKMTGAIGLIRKLQSGNFIQQLEALRSIVARALANEKFRHEFCRFSGMELLVKLMGEALVEAMGTSGVIPGVLPAFPGASGAAAAAAAAAGASPLLQLLVKALEALNRSQECRDYCINAGGVPTLLKLLSCASGGSAATPPPSSTPPLRTSKEHAASPAMAFSPDMTRSSSGGASSCVSSGHAGAGRDSSDGGASGAGDHAASVALASTTLACMALACLEHLSSHPAARDAMREAEGMPLIVGLVSRQYDTGSVVTQQAVAVLKALAADPALKDAVGHAGGAAALLTVIRYAAPKSPVHNEALVSLHTLMRGSRSNQLALAQLPDSFSHLRAGLAGLGPCWHPCKADLHALLTILSRFPPDMPCHGSSITGFGGRPGAVAAATAAGPAHAAAAGRRGEQEGAEEEEDEGNTGAANRPASPSSSTNSFVMFNREAEDVHPASD